MTRTTASTTSTDDSLVTAAARGDQRSFDELHRRHAPLAWRLALAITGRPDEATAALVSGTGATFTAVRAGRFQAASPALALATATRNAALDLRRNGDAIASPIVADDADPLLASAFGALPERWRSVLWLRDAEGIAAKQAAAVVELTPEAVDQLAVRARRGLRERYLRAQLTSSSSRDCTRATTRLGAFEDATLGEVDRSTLERHLDGCAACAQRRASVSAIPAALGALATAPPTDLRDQARAAWTAALASTSSTGLSPRTEKILAGASAFAAAVGVLGAAVFGTGGDSDPVASPLAPLVADIDAPRPIDLTSLALPVLDDPLPPRTRSFTTSSPTPQGTGGGTGLVAAPAPAPPAPAPAAPGTAPDPVGSPTPAAEIPTAPGQLPIDVSLGEDTAVAVGPIRVDLDPASGQPPLAIEVPEQLAPLAPVLDPVIGVVNTVAEPVTGTVAPVLDAAKPITSGLNSFIDGIGL